MEFADVYAVGIRILYVFGLAPFKFSNDKSQMVSRFEDNFAVLVSFFITGTISALAIALRAAVETFMDIRDTGHLQGLAGSAQQGQVCTAALVYATLLVIAIAKKQAHMKLFQTILSVDRDIVKFFRYELNYSKHRKWINRTAAIITIYNIIFTFCIIVYTTIMRNNFIETYMVPIYGASQTYPQCLTIHYCVMCKIITERFKIIESLAKSNLTKHQFENLLNINRHARQAVHNLNDALGFSQFLNIMNNNITITWQTFLGLYMMLSPDGNKYLHWNIGASWWLFLFFLQIIFTAKVGNDLKMQVLKTNRALDENTSLRNQDKHAQLLSGCPFDKLYETKLQCTAGGYFAIDHSLITLMVSTITSYLIILMQFQQEANQI